MMLKLSSLALASLVTLSSTVVCFYASQAAGWGRAPWYSPPSRPPSGERQNPNNLTPPHRTLRFGTKVKVTNAKNGKSVVVRINDRGPFIRGRVLDLSKAAASNIGMIRSGHAKICYEVLG